MNTDTIQIIAQIFLVFFGGWFASHHITLSKVDLVGILGGLASVIGAIWHIAHYNAAAAAPAQPQSVPITKGNGMPPTVPLLVLAAILLCLPARAQTNDDIFTNLPIVALNQETLGISIGPVTTQNGNLSEANLFDFSFSPSFFARAEFDTTTGGSGINALGIGAGYQRVFSTSKIWADLEAMRNLSPGQWEAGPGIGAAWAPSNSGLLQKFSIGAEGQLTFSADRSIAIGTRALSFIRYSL